jgi:carbonic anhydrase
MEPERIHAFRGHRADLVQKLKPVTLSDAQLAALAKLHPGNARPIQAANGRQILETQ